MNWDREVGSCIGHFEMDLVVTRTPVLDLQSDADSGFSILLVDNLSPKFLDLAVGKFCKSFVFNVVVSFWY